MKRLAVAMGKIVGIAAVILAVAALMALPMMLLVNYLFADTAIIAVFGAPEIGFSKAFWLNVLISFVMVRGRNCSCSKE